MYTYDQALFHERWIGPPGVPRCNSRLLHAEGGMGDLDLGAGIVLARTAITGLVFEPSYPERSRSLSELIVCRMFFCGKFCDTQ